MTGARHIEVVDDVAAVAAERIAGCVRAGGNIALAGGSTPRAAYEVAAAMALDWSPVTLWFGDERAVGPDSEWSNFRMVRQSLLDRIGGPLPAVHRIRGELGYEQAAAAYRDELAAAFGADGPPTFDLILLGIGPDAHTASLFPGDPALGVRDRAVVGVPVPGMAPLVPRVTLTLPALDAGHEVVFLITGTDKAEAVARAFGDAPGPDAPAGLVAPADGRLTALADRAAVARLEAGS